MRSYAVAAWNVPGAGGLFRLFLTKCVGQEHGPPEYDMILVLMTRSCNKGKDWHTRMTRKIWVCDKRVLLSEY